MGCSNCEGLGVSQVYLDFILKRPMDFNNAPSRYCLCCTSGPLRAFFDINVQDRVRTTFKDYQEDVVKVSKWSVDVL